MREAGKPVAATQEDARNDVTHRSVPPSPGTDTDANPLAEAIRRAAEAGQWEIVARLAALLEREPG